MTVVRPTMWSLLALLALAACSPSMVAPTGEPLRLIVDGPLHDSATVQAMVRLANDPDTTAGWLTGEVGLVPSLASSIVAHRQGDDALDGTWDDDPFDDGFELGKVTRMDADGLGLLAQAVHDLDLVAAIVVEDVPFTVGQHDAVLAAANAAAYPDLDAVLNQDTVDAIVLGRPYSSLFDLADRPGVGPSALEALRDFAPQWALDNPAGEVP